CAGDSVVPANHDLRVIQHPWCDKQPRAEENVRPTSPADFRQVSCVVRLGSGSFLVRFHFAFTERLCCPRPCGALAREFCLSIAGRLDVDFDAILTGRFRTFNRAAWHASAHQPCRCRVQASHRDIDQWPAAPKLALRMNEIHRQVVDGLTRSKLRIRRGTNPPWRTWPANSRNAGGIKGISSSV